MSENILTLIRLLYARTQSRRLQYVMMKIALTFVGVINSDENLVGVKVSLCNAGPACEQIICRSASGTHNMLIGDASCVISQ